MVLKKRSREISTLSPTLRSAWDGRPLQLLTRTAPARATGAHISMIGHITHAELRHHLTARRARQRAREPLPALRLPPHPPAARRRQRDPLAGTGLTACSAARSSTPAPPASSASTPTPASCGSTPTRQLATAQPAGIAGALCARAEAHTIRLALLYALADGDRQINTEHLQAALALWDYAARSATWALQGATGDPLAEQIHAALDHHPRRADPQPDLRHPATQPARRADPTSARRARARRPRDPHPDPHRRPPRRALDRRTRTRRLTAPEHHVDHAQHHRICQHHHRRRSLAVRGGTRRNLDLLPPPRRAADLHADRARSQSADRRDHRAAHHTTTVVTARQRRFALTDPRSSAR